MHATALATTIVGEGPRVVFVHGFTQTRMSWGAVAQHVAVAGHQAVLVDAPGHGGSHAIEANLWQAAELLAEAGERATYVGYSMGGRMALHVALARPEVVDRLVLVSATAGIDDPAERAARRAADEQLAADLELDGLDTFLERWLANPLFATLPADAAGLDDRRQNTVAALASSLRLAGTGTQDPLWDRLSEVRRPALIVAGRDDSKFTALAQRLAAGIADSQLFVLRNAGHSVHLEQPEAFTAALLGFLTTPPVPP